MVGGILSPNSLSYRVLVTLLFFLIFILITVLTELYPLIFFAPLLAGFFIGRLTEGGAIDRGKASLIGVTTFTLIMIFVLIIPLFLLTPWPMENKWIWNLIVITIAIFSIIIFSILGFIGGFISGMITRIPSKSKTAEP